MANMNRLASKTLKGYTTQARWYAANTDADNSLIGWTRLASNITKPVFKTNDGDAFVVLDDSDSRAGYTDANGLNHLSVRIVPCVTHIFATEEELWASEKGTV